MDQITRAYLYTLTHAQHHMTQKILLPYLCRPAVIWVHIKIVSCYYHKALGRELEGEKLVKASVHRETS